MNSIDRNQPEDNMKDLAGSEAVEKIREIVKSAETCFFCTNLEGEIDARPMNVRQVDDEGSFWFLSAADSHKNQELATDSKVELFLQGSNHSDFLQIKGRAIVSRDRAKIDELWSPFIKTWFTEGKDDPRITVIQVVPDGGYYWDNKHGDMVAGVKIMIGAAIGKTLDDSVQGKVELR
jgi:general stress protein 26